ncbi:helix-turn-helix domain-containing protein [Sphingomonas sp. BK069]|uniref:winged helix-turn-helix transcriptional regulator n=1 Tax=Sphingomonas sp. BK069 TaxID=2586979 RepID=UPI001607AB0C|nr:helix-turn-helix domain-containing protein [Sphingomonas sp. BK069]MBB3348334.1 DNA-binding HxlR family transcriptional regulator [Sphingomonas sp. BK069]
MRCSIAGSLELIGDRWALLIVRDLLMRPTRFEDLRSSLDIPPATLATRLKRLEEAGLVVRSRYQERPPRDEYRLTPQGRDLWKVSIALREWGDRWDTSGYGAPTIVVADRETGRPLELAMVDRETGERVPPSRIELRPGPGAVESTHRLLASRKGASR